MKVYLDNCCYNRPFDDQEHMGVRLETAAKLHIQNAIRAGEYDLVWSYMNEYENSANPYADKREAIATWEYIAAQLCPPSDQILQRAQLIDHKNIRQKDALNIACAIDAGCDYFVTTDKPLLKKRPMIAEITIIDPIAFVREQEEINAGDH
jgi:predicted nucleic acid-binding protein